MAELLLENETEQIVEGSVLHIAERPIPFDRFLEMAEGRWLELVDGMVVEKPMIQLDHERCTRWLYQVMGLYVQKRQLGEMLSSRIMVRTAGFGGRMPDLLFVKQENSAIVQQKAVYGAPDLIVEVVSPHDRPSALQKLETDYHQLGVPELVFVHLKKQELRHLLRTDDGYTQTVLTSGPLTFVALPDLTLAVEWILREPRPDVVDTLAALFPRP